MARVGGGKGTKQRVIQERGEGKKLPIQNPRGGGGCHRGKKGCDIDEPNKAQIKGIT